MVRNGSKIRYGRYIFFKEIGLRAQHMITILGSLINIWWGSKSPFNEHDNLHDDNEQNIHVSS